MTIRQFSGEDPNYKFLGYIASGSFGRVTKVSRRKDGKVLACKAIDYSGGNTKLFEAIQREITILQTLKGCQSCVQWNDDVGLDAQKETIYLYMDYCNSGSLKDFIDQTIASGSKPIPEDYIIGIMEDLVNALRACHRAGIIHRDIKPGNILSHTYRAGEYVPDFKRCYSGPTVGFALADFGLGKFSSGRGGPLGSIGSAVVGTEIYMAPESVGPRATYGPKSDIFSLGCVLYELCELRRAFYSSSKKSAPSMRSSYSPGLKTLVQDCMAINPAKRPDTETLYRRFQAIDVGRKDEDGAFVSSKGRDRVVGQQPSNSTKDDNCLVM